MYASGHIKEVGEALVKVIGPLAEDEKEPAHCRILEGIVTRSGEVTLLAWTGKSSTCNSSLPSSPSVYGQHLFAPPRLSQTELEKRADELRATFPPTDALVIYGRFTRLQPVRFAHFRLHLPCIIFGVTRLRKEPENVFHAETAGLGDVEFTTADVLPLKKPRRLAFVDTRIHDLRKLYDVVTLEDRLESDAEPNSDSGHMNAELVHAPIIEEVPVIPSDTYTRALQLIAHLEQPFSAMLLLQMSDGAYRRVAADHEIVVRGTGNNFPKEVRVEVLEIL